MKVVGLITGLFLVASLAHAQTDTTSTTTSSESLMSEETGTISAEAPVVETAPETASRGLRVTVFLPQLKAKARPESGNATPASRLDRTFGVGVGYANLPIRRLGWMASAALMELTDLDENRNEVSQTAGRLDANLAFAMNQYFYLKAGGNVSGFLASDNRDAFEPWFGYQAALGAQLTPTIGLEAGYILMSQTGKDNSGIDELEQSGLDFSITATF